MSQTSEAVNEPIEVIDRLEGLRSQWWLFSTLCAFVWTLVASLGALALLFLLNLVFPLPVSILRALFVLWIAASLGLLAAAVVRALRSQRSLEAAARRIEQTFPQLENNLISLVQWSDSADPPDGFRRAAIRHAAEQAAEVPMETAADFQTRHARWQLRLQTPRDLVESLGVLLTQIALLFLLSYLPQWSQSSDRFWKSFGDGEAANSVEANQAADNVKQPFQGENDD